MTKLARQLSPLTGAEEPGGLNSRAMDERLGPWASEHLHPALGTEHPLLIGGQDQGLFPRHVVRLGADVALAIEKQHPQQPASGIEEMHRDDANRAGAAEGSISQSAPGE